ncbi:hypothetical protein SCP_1501010 [Sparassis crispa]|uniref:Uncharacterized protein n=1 Tax=Sparassis crispa TaxID=139825 RepID=A0A401H3U2_9APHY|nr:hypothetical protein SCP_1501010 [Sparassis crispa]GBE89098.1 hypothetical protein SCP_1501010 [Sparassis crispa]
MCRIHKGRSKAYPSYDVACKVVSGKLAIARLRQEAGYIFGYAICKATPFLSVTGSSKENSQTVPQPVLS